MKIDQQITLKFDPKKYSMGFSFLRRKGEGKYSMWLGLDAKFTVDNSRKFVELCYRFLNNYYTIFPERCRVKQPHKINERWDKMKNEISLSI